MVYLMQKYLRSVLEGTPKCSNSETNNFLSQGLMTIKILFCKDD